MMRYLLGGVALATLAACGGSGNRTFVGAIPITLDENGAVAGIDASALTSVETDVGGFAFGLAEDVDATVIGNSAGAASGDQGSFAVSGIFAEPDVGPAFASGIATYDGEYAMTVFTGHEETSDAAAWAREDFSGGFTATIDLHMEGSDDDDPDHGHSHEADEILMTAQSDDGRIFFDDVLLFQLQLPAQPDVGPFHVEGGVATIDGVEVSLSSQVTAGQGAVIGAFQGEGANTLVAGGFVAEN